jgi:single-strand DNA-binding protein
MTMHASAYGRLGRDPKPINTQSGKPMASASIAVDMSTQRDPDATHWLPLLAFGQQAEALLRHAQGDMLAVTGRLQRNTWTDKDGTHHIDLQLIADQITSSRTVRPGGGRRKSNGGGRDAQREIAESAAMIDDPLTF